MKIWAVLYLGVTNIMHKVYNIIYLLYILLYILVEMSFYQQSSLLFL